MATLTVRDTGSTWKTSFLRKLLGTTSADSGKLLMVDGSGDIAAGTPPNDMSRKRIALIAPGATTAPTVFGTAQTSVGTLSHPALAVTNNATQTRRVVNTSSGTAGALASTRGTQAECCGTNGYTFIIRFTFETIPAIATFRAFFGLVDVITAPTNVVPTTSTTPGKIGVGCAANTGNLYIINCITGTTPTTYHLSSGDFTVQTQIVYELKLVCAVGGASVVWTMTNVTNGYYETGTLTTNIPAAATYLDYAMWTCNNTLASASAFSIVRMYMEPNT